MSVKLKFNDKRNAGPESYSPAPPSTPLVKRRAASDENQAPALTPLNKRRKKETMGALVDSLSHNTPLRRDENLLGTPFTFATPNQAGKARRHLEDEEKFDRICDALDEASWTFSEMLGFAFLHPGTISRSHRHAGIISRFLRGETLVTPGQILRLWDNHPDGRMERDSTDMYSTDTHYSLIKSVRPSLTSYAAQKCLAKVHREGSAAVKPDAGLHASARKNSKETNKLEWRRIGLSTVETTECITRKLMPLSVSLMSKIAGDGPLLPKPPSPPKPKPKTADEVAGSVEQTELVEGQSSEVVQAQKDVKLNARRPTNVVVTHALSSLLYKRNSEARLLPLALGLLAFSYSTPVDFMAYCSHVAVMPAHTTISKSLKLFAEDQAVYIRAHGSGATTAGFIQADNVQNYLRVRDYRMGSVNKMNIGIAATYCELPDVNIASLDLDDRIRRVKENKRASLTFDKLWSFLDKKHLDTIIPLHWLRILVDYIPELNYLKPQVSELFKTRSARISVCIPPGATPVYPLSSSGKCENVTTELKDAMFDFLGQVGQKENDYRKRLIMVGGDGLTFQRILELQRYLQFHADPRENLSIVEPVLSPWHTEWTDASRIYERLCDGPTSADPSTIGHSATVIGRRTPVNESKIDYYPDIDTLYLVLDVRVLDCWRIQYGDSPDIFQHFSRLAASGKLPTLEELEEKAKLLHKTYSTTRAVHMALGDTSIDTEWSKNVPEGKKWVKRGDESLDRQGRDENGDRVLANSITLIRDALISREISYAIAQGDAGRVYEMMKYLLFSFAGSSHQKYCSYLLEVVTRFELESSPELVKSILKTTLVNLSGLEGTCMASDIMQEYFNRLLEAIIEKKGIDYGDPYARNIISPNLGHFARIKLNLRSGVGMAKRAGKHSSPGQDPEVRKLSEAYKKHELHKRRPGRVYKDTDRDDFTRGIQKLKSGRLQRWVLETTHWRGLMDEDKSGASEKLTVAEEEMEEEGEEANSQHSLQTLGMAQMLDGRLVVDTFTADEVCATFDEFMAEVDEVTD